MTKKKVDIWCTHLCVAVFLSSQCIFILDCQSWNSRKASVCALSRSADSPALRHWDRFRHFPNRAEQHPWMESFISWYAVQLPCPAHIPSHLSKRWTLSVELWSLGEVYTVLGHTTPTQSHRTKALWGHNPTCSGRADCCCPQGHGKCHVPAAVT